MRLSVAMLSGYSVSLISALEKSLDVPVSACYLYYRGCTVRVENDMLALKRQCYLNEDGDAGVVLKLQSGMHVLIELSGNSLTWEQGMSFRFKVDAFEIVSVAKGPFSLKIVIDYLKSVKHKLYGEGLAMKPRDFAVDCFGSISRASGDVKVIDMTDTVIQRLMK